MMSKTTCICMLLSASSSSIHHHYQNDHHGLLSPQPSVFLTKSIRGFPSLKFSPPSLSLRSSYFYPSCDINFHGSRFQGISNHGNDNTRSSSSFSLNAQMNIGIIGKAQKWWEKGLQPNIKEINGAQDLVETLLNAGDKLVIVDFFSPGCGGCRALHPKICQFAKMNPDVQFLQVNYEEHKSMCYTLNVHVLPFFRFYRGAHGRLCSFSCTNATIKKFKDALAKHSPDRCSLGPPKGLEEKELLALAANKDLSFNYAPKPEQQPVPVPAGEEIVVEMPPVLASHKEAEPSLSLPLPLPLPSTSSSAAQDLVGLGR